MDNKFSSFSDTVSSPAIRLFAITPHDSNELPIAGKGLYIGSGGTISIVALGDTDPVTLTVPAGIILPVRARIVRATGTTATGIVGLA